MTTKNKAAPGANRAASGNAADHSGNHNATAQKIGNSPYGPDFVQISNEEAMRRMCGAVPGLMFVRLSHDAWCKTLKTNRGDDCNCNPDESYWLDKGGAA